jgi:hypothetical protein
MKMRSLLENAKNVNIDMAIEYIKSLDNQPLASTEDIEPNTILEIIKQLKG